MGGLLAITLGKPKKSPEGEDDGSPKLDAAKALLKAIKLGDSEAVSSALEEHYACCASDHEGGEEDEEMDE